jgi:hypothetical protein
VAVVGTRVWDGVERREEAMVRRAVWLCPPGWRFYVEVAGCRRWAARDAARGFAGGGVKSRREWSG